MRFSGRSLPVKPCANGHPSIDVGDGGGFNSARGTRPAKRIGKLLGDRKTIGIGRLLLRSAHASSVG